MMFFLTVRHLSVNGQLHRDKHKLGQTYSFFVLHGSRNSDSDLRCSRSYCIVSLFWVFARQVFACVRVSVIGRTRLQGFCKHMRRANLHSHPVKASPPHILTFLRQYRRHVIMRIYSISEGTPPDRVPESTPPARVPEGTPHAREVKTTHLTKEGHPR